MFPLAQISAARFSHRQSFRTREEHSFRANATRLLFGFLLTYRRPAFVRTSHHTTFPLWTSEERIITVDGKGATVSLSGHFRRPRMNRISPASAFSHHHSVSGRAGTRQTTVAPAWASSLAFDIQSLMARPYGGFIQQRRGAHVCLRPSSFGEKKSAHLALSLLAHTSKSSLNSLRNKSNSQSGVSHSVILDFPNHSPENLSSPVIVNSSCQYSASAK